MCEWGNTVDQVVLIPAELSHTGEARWDTKEIDFCIAPIVKALNAAGIHTSQSCCGHGKADGRIDLHDGRVLIIKSSSDNLILSEVTGSETAMKNYRRIKRLERATVVTITLLLLVAVVGSIILAVMWIRNTYSPENFTDPCGVSFDSMACLDWRMDKCLKAENNDVHKCLRLFGAG